MIKSKLLMIVSDIANINCSEISVDRSVKDMGIDSINVLVLRESIERSFGIYINDNIWFELISYNKSLQDLINYLDTFKGNIIAESNNSDKPPRNTMHNEYEAVSLLNNGLIKSFIEIGMPLTGRNKLAEGPLLQKLGDLRWTHMCQVAGVKSKNIIDAQGNRLYPTFFYVEIEFPEHYPMAHFGENDCFQVLGELKRFGTSMLDGRFFLFPEGIQFNDNVINMEPSEILRSGVPIIRLSNIFVMQFNGAEWLKKSRPANTGFEDIPETFEPPSCYEWVKSAENEILSFNIPDNYIPINDKPLIFEYNLVPDRDLNGAGLVYFANYPVFLDICERKLLETSPYIFEDNLINSRTLVSRQSGYFNNASAKDTLEVEISAFLENPFSSNHKFPELAPIRFIFNYRMFRKSDKRLMMASTAKKIIYGMTAEDLSFYNDLDQSNPDK